MQHIYYCIHSPNNSALLGFNLWVWKCCVVFLSALKTGMEPEYWNPGTLSAGLQSRVNVYWLWCCCNTASWTNCDAPSNIGTQGSLVGSSGENFTLQQFSLQKYAGQQRTGGMRLWVCGRKSDISVRMPCGNQTWQWNPRFVERRMWKTPKLTISLTNLFGVILHHLIFSGVYPISKTSNMKKTHVFEWHKPWISWRWFHGRSSGSNRWRYVNVPYLLAIFWGEYSLKFRPYII